MYRHVIYLDEVMDLEIHSSFPTKHTFNAIQSGRRIGNNHEVDGYVLILDEKQRS